MRVFCVRVTGGFRAFWLLINIYHIMRVFCVRGVRSCNASLPVLSSACVYVCVYVCVRVCACVCVCVFVLSVGEALGLRVAVCCGVLRCVAVCCSVLRCVAVCCRVLQCAYKILPAINFACLGALDFLQCGAVRCSALYTSGKGRS